MTMAVAMGMVLLVIVWHVTLFLMLLLFVALVFFYCSSWPWSCSFVVPFFLALAKLFCYQFLWPWMGFSTPNICGLGRTFLLLFFIALVMPFYSYYLWPWLCFSATILHGFGCVLLLLLIIVLVVFFYYCFSQPWSCFSIVVFHGLNMQNGFFYACSQSGNGFSRRNYVFDIGSIGNGLLCFYLWFQNPYNINNTHQQKSCHLQLV